MLISQDSINSGIGVIYEIAGDIVLPHFMKENIFIWQKHCSAIIGRFHLCIHYY